MLAILVAFSSVGDRQPIDGGINGGKCVAQRADGSLTRHTEIASDRGLMSVDVEVAPSSGTTAGRVRQTLSIEIDHQLFMRLEATTTSSDLVESHVTFGPLVAGMKRADFTSDGKTLRGDYDGREIVPMAPKGEARDLAFVDGKPPPSVELSADFQKAVTDLLQKAHGNSPSCSQPSGLGIRDYSSPGTPGTSESPGTSIACITCDTTCFVAFGGCVYGGGELCAAFLTIPFFGTALFAACLAGTLIVCAEISRVCLVGCTNDFCCPVGCGERCCEKDEACLDPRAGTCCKPGAQACNQRACCGGTDLCLTHASSDTGQYCCPNTPEDPHYECAATDGSAGTTCCRFGIPERRNSDGCLSTGRCCPGGQAMCVDAAGKENAVCCDPGQGCFAYLSQPRHCQRCEADTGGERCNQRCCATDLQKCTDFENSTCCRNEAVCRLPIGSCCDDGNDCVHFPDGDACCPTDAACNDPPTCCKGGKVCIKHPADSGPQFCCPEAFACGSRACCSDPRAPCARGFPSELDHCCSAPALCTDSRSGRVTCCEGATSCIAFPDGHNQCCQRDWLCGTGPGAICCPPPDVSGGGLCTRTDFGYECLPAF